MSYMDLPCIKKLDKFLSKLSNNSERVICINFPTSLYKVILFLIDKLKLKYKVIYFEDISDGSVDMGLEKESIFRKISAEIINFLVEMNPLVGFIDFIANIALEIANHQITRSQIESLKKIFFIHQKPKKHKKLKKIFVVNNFSILQSEDASFINFIGLLIKGGYITDTTLLIISDSNMQPDNFFDGLYTLNVQLTKEDYNILLGTERPSPHMIEIVNSIDVGFFDKINNFYKDKENISDKNIEDIINILIKSKGYNFKKDELNHFLKICSLLFEEFNTKDLENLEDIIKNPYRELLSNSKDALLLESVKLNSISSENIDGFGYRFTEMLFREYYQKNADIILDYISYDQIMDYLQEQYPTHYAELAISSLIMPLKKSKKLSYVIIAYYHHKEQPLKFHEIIRHSLEKNIIGKKILKLEKYKQHRGSYAEEEIRETYKEVLELTRVNTEIDAEAHLCILSYIADVMYTLEEDNSLIIALFNRYRKLFDDIQLFTCPDLKYFTYVLDAVSFSTMIEDFSVKKVTDRLISWIEQNECDNLALKIKYYRLGNLLFALNEEKKETYTHLAFEMSKDNIIVHEETRINYSVTLIGKGKYKEAFSLLSDCEVHTSDYKFPMMNNKYIAAFLCGKQDIKQVLKEFLTLLQNITPNLTGDYPIILNNYIAALIMAAFEKNYVDIIKCSEYVLKSLDIYHQFFTMHNLLILYYLKGDHENFCLYKKKIETPYLLRKYCSIFEYKWEFLEKNWGQYKSIKELQNAMKFPEDLMMYGDSIYMSIILWGLLERWFK